MPPYCCIPPAAACLWKVFTAEANCSYELSIAFKAVGDWAMACGGGGGGGGWYS